MLVVQVIPGRKPEVTEIDNTLEEIQDIVGGYFECVPTSLDNVLILCNEDGKNLGLPANRITRNVFGAYDLIVGNMLIVGVDGEDFCDLTVDQIAYILDQISDVFCEV